MSLKYIPQLNNENFVYPNYDLAEYDVDIIHSINDNSVSGTVINFSAATISNNVITFGGTYTWYRNNSEVFRRPLTNNVAMLSVHMIAPTQTYYKAWIPIFSQSILASIYTGQTSYSGSLNFQISSSNIGLPPNSFTSGNYYFEFRFVGAQAIYPICQTLSITVP